MIQFFCTPLKKKHIQIISAVQLFALIMDTLIPNESTFHFQ